MKNLIQSVKSIFIFKYNYYNQRQYMHVAFKLSKPNANSHENGHKETSQLAKREDLVKIHG